MLKEIRLGSINKEGLLKNKSPKGDPGGSIAKLLKVISFIAREEFIFLLLNSYRFYFIRFYSFK